MLDCPTGLTFSPTHSQKRIQRVSKIFGLPLLKRILGFALFLLGANRQEIAAYLNLPYGTFLSFLTRMEKFGLDAFEDRRKSSEGESSSASPPPPLEFSLHKQDQKIFLQFNSSTSPLIIPESNALQAKVVLLTFFHNRLLSAEAIASVLGYSPRHVRELGHRIYNQDVPALIDQRAGQLMDYRFTPEIKAELIQQFAANVISGQPVSSRSLSKDLLQRCRLSLSDRSIRHHTSKLGLATLKTSLPALVEQLKKTPDDSTQR